MPDKDILEATNESFDIILDNIKAIKEILKKILGEKNEENNN